MDGPSVNMKCYTELVKTQEEAHLPNLINIGTYSLHVIHGAFKTGIESTNLEMKKTFKRKLSIAPWLTCSQSRLFKCYRVGYILRHKMVVGKQVADKLLEMNFWQTLPKLLKLQARKGSNKWNKVFKNGPSKICGRQPLKNLKWNVLKAVFHEFYLVHSWMPWPICYYISSVFYWCHFVLQKWFCSFPKLVIFQTCNIPL